MIIVNAGYEILDIPSPYDHDGVLKHIEKIARTCYKSESKITDISAVRMIENLKEHKHWAMLEHYVFTIAVDYGTFKCIDNLRTCAKYPECVMTRTTKGILVPLATGIADGDLEIASKAKYLTLSTDCIENSEFPSEYESDYEYLISGSATAFNYLLDACEQQIHSDNNLSWNDSKFSALNNLCYFLYTKYPELFNIPSELVTPYRSAEDGVNYRFLEAADFEKLPIERALMHQNMSVRFIVDRGISHEIVRHRPASFAQESTRYCNYSKQGFGCSITVIKPPFFDVGTSRYDKWMTACKYAEHLYFSLIDDGCTPQEARSVLPNSLKTELVMTTNMREWIHFFKMRVPSAAHPQMREVSIPLFKDVLNIYPRIFRDYEYFINEHEVTK